VEEEFYEVGLPFTAFSEVQLRGAEHRSVTRSYLINAEGRI
jgi:hypothetical protein